MKIAVFTDTYKPQMNGVVAYLADSLAVLSKEHDVVLFAPADGPLRTEKVSERFRIIWVPSLPFPFYDGYRVASLDYRRISAMLRAEKPDIIHAHAPINLGIQGIIAGKRAKVPVIVTYHTHFPDYVPHLLNGKLPKIFHKAGEYTAKKFVKHMFSMADVVTAPTEELAEELRSYGLRNVMRMPNGIDLAKIKASERCMAEFRKTYGTGGKKVVLYLGRVSFEKRLEILLEAFKHAEKPDRVLVVAGSGPYLPKFKEFAKMIGIKNVIFTGFVEHRLIGAAYACADIFASASDTETFGLTFVEAMHMGLPCIGVGRLGAKEVISHGNTGLLVAPGDHLALGKAMDKLLSDDALRKRMSASAREASGEFAIEKSVKEMMRIYTSVIAGKKAQAGR